MDLSHPIPHVIEHSGGVLISKPVNQPYFTQPPTFEAIIKVVSDIFEVQMDFCSVFYLLILFFHTKFDVSLPYVTMTYLEELRVELVVEHVRFMMTEFLEKSYVLPYYLPPVHVEGELIRIVKENANLLREFKGSDIKQTLGELLASQQSQPASLRYNGTKSAKGSIYNMMNIIARHFGLNVLTERAAINEAAKILGVRLQSPGEQIRSLLLLRERFRLACIQHSNGQLLSNATTKEAFDYANAIILAILSLF